MYLSLCKLIYVTTDVIIPLVIYILFSMIAK